MAPLPFVPFANTLPAIAIILLCLGIAERDGVLLIAGYVVARYRTCMSVGCCGSCCAQDSTAGRFTSQGASCRADLAGS